MFGSKFAPYCLQNSVLSCEAVTAGLMWSKTKIKADCRHETQMHSLQPAMPLAVVTKYSSQACDYYNCQVQCADQTANHCQLLVKEET